MAYLPLESGFTSAEQAVRSLLAWRDSLPGWWYGVQLNEAVPSSLAALFGLSIDELTVLFYRASPRLSRRNDRMFFHDKDFTNSFASVCGNGVQIVKATVKLRSDAVKQDIIG